MRFEFGSFGSLARLILLTGACTLAASRLAHAGPSEASAAQALFDDAKALMNQGNYSAACAKLEESQRLDPALGTLLNLADCRDKEGKIATAWSAFREAEGVARRVGHADAQEVARSRAQTLLVRVPRLVVDVAAGQPKGFRLARNDVEIGAPQWGAAIPIDPGHYELVASAPGYREFRATATLEDGGGTVTISIPALTPKASKEHASVPAQAPKASAEKLASDGERAEAADVRKAASGGGASVPTASWILGGVGIAALGTSLALGAWANSQYDSADCPDHACSNSEELAERDHARTKATAATIVFIAGTAAVIGGITVWALSPSEESLFGVHDVAVRAGLSGVSLSGVW